MKPIRVEFPQFDSVHFKKVPAGLSEVVYLQVLIRRYRRDGASKIELLYINGYLTLRVEFP